MDISKNFDYPESDFERQLSAKFGHAVRVLVSSARRTEALQPLGVHLWPAVRLNQIGFLQNPLIYLDAPERVFEAQTSLMDPSHRRVLAQPERFPYLARMADKVPGRPYEANFELALDTVIAALEVRVRGRPAARTAGRTPARSRAR